MNDENIHIEIPKQTEENWQEIVNILAQIYQVPAALIMRWSHPDIEVLISSRSEGNPYHPGDREHFEDSGLYCETVVKSGNRLLVPDALADAHWKNNPDVKLNMISYLGYPLLLPTGKPFGTICVLDSKQNEYSPVLDALLAKFKALIESQLETIYMNQLLGEKNKKLSDYLMEIQAFRGSVAVCSSCKSIREDQGQWQPIERYLIRHPEATFTHGLCPTCLKTLYPDFDEDEEDWE